MKRIIFYVSIVAMIILNLLVDLNINRYIDLLSRCFEKSISLSTSYYAFICSIIALISILILVALKLIIFNKKDEIKGINLKSEDGTFGTANWLNDKEIKAILGKGNVPGIILGKRNGEIIKLPFDSFFNKNIAVFGSSGSMKTIGFLITNLLELLKYKKSIVVTDAKRRDIS